MSELVLNVLHAELLRLYWPVGHRLLCVDTVGKIEPEQKLHAALLEARERLARRGVLLGDLDDES